MIEDGFYLIYVKNKIMYSTIMGNSEWDLLQILANAVTDDPVKLYENSLGEVKTYEGGENTESKTKKVSS